MSTHFSSHLTEQRLLAAEVLALVVGRLFPHVILVGGGIHSLGFYYDFIFEQPLTKSMLEFIEIHMHPFIKEGHVVHSISMMRENAQVLLEHHKHFFLAQRAGEQKTNIVELIQIEEFYDLCPALSLTTTHEIGSIKLLEVQELKQEEQKEALQLTRILGASQTSAKDLKIFLKMYDSFLKKKDHRVLGPQLKLFNFFESAGALGVTWYPKGVQVQGVLLDWLKRQQPEGENLISTPSIVRQDVLGSETLSLEPFSFEGEEYRLRSSVLHQHLEFLSHFPLQEEELPWRMTEWAPIFRQYPEPQRWGLFCHCAYQGEQTTICCLREQVVSELISSLHFIEQIITIFGFKAHWSLIASRQKSSKARQEQQAIDWLKQAIQTQDRVYPYSSEIQEEQGEPPRLELRIWDVLGREWPISRLNVILSTQALELLPPVQQGEEKRRVILTRQIWESLDRFVALLIEHYEGKFPSWLAPEQIRVIAIGEANRAYAQQVSECLQHKGIRVKLDLRQTKLSMRVHEAEKERVPYLILVGEKERKLQKISVRVAKGFNRSQSMEIETFLNQINHEFLCPMPLRKRTE